MYRAAETIGCRVHGITLSKEQKALAEEKVGFAPVPVPPSSPMPLFICRSGWCTFISGRPRDQ